MLSQVFQLNQSDKCVHNKFDDQGNYNKFDDRGNYIIFCYVDDMLIFWTNLVQVDMTWSFLSSYFKMKNKGELDVIHGIKIIRDKYKLILIQAHYVKKILQ